MAHSILRVLVVLSALSLAAARLRVVESGRNGKRGPTIRNGFVYCPKRRGYSIECIPPRRVKSVLIKVNRRTQRERRAPFMAYGNNGPNTFKVRVTGKITIKCWNKRKRYSEEVTGYIGCGGKKKSMPKKDKKMMPKKGKKSMPKKDKKMMPKKGMKSMPMGRNMCVTIKGTDYVGRLSKGWERTSRVGVTFKKNSNTRRTVGSRHSVLKYTFKVPKKSRYGITVDMTTKHSSEHNDIWLRCDGGFMGFLGSKKTKNFPDKFIKVYHNRNGRATEAKTEDYVGYTLASRYTLVPGRTYTCEVGARSTKTTLNAIIMFPCESKTCRSYSKHWKKFVKTCAV